MQIWLILLSAFSVTAAGIVILIDRYKTKRILNEIDKMLDEAIKGDFLESTWDESVLSSVEGKLARYLKSSALSSRNLREQKAKIEALVADISHQTKTPIANILLYAQLLEEQNIPEETRPLVTSLIGQSEKLKMLIEALVKTSRLETGIFQFHPKRNEVETMLAEAVRQYLPKAKKKQIRLTLETGDAEAIFDSKWTAEAVGNLLDNAIKNTPSGGAVSVNVSEYDMFCRVDVSDNGCGILEEEQAKVFQRFYRSPSAADAEGVGIGLFLTRQIITGQGGYIKLTSKPGEGSTFSVFLPRE